MVGRPPFGASGMDNVLLVCNTASSDSMDVANYYVNNRPGAVGVDVCPVNCVTTETIVYSDMQRDIKNPIAAWCVANPSKPKKYILLCLGIPTRCSFGPGGKAVSVPYAISTLRSDADISGGAFQNSEYSGIGGLGGMTAYLGDGGRFNQHFSTASYPNTKYLVMTLNMGNSLAAVQTYIDKIAVMYRAMATPNVAVSSRGASRSGTQFIFDDANTVIGGGGILVNPEQSLRVTDGCLTTTYSYPSLQNNIANLACYSAWGTHNGSWGSGTYPSGQLVLSGNSNWYIVSTVESFNGDVGGGQGNFIQWWDNGVGGGTNGSRTPIGMATHTEEPGVSGCEADSFSRNWFAGFNLAETLWSSRGTMWFMAVGDPLVIW